METKLLKPFGYCLGVINAINLAKKVRKDFPTSNVYIFGHLVHNELVTKELEKLNIISLDVDNPLKMLNNFKKEDIVIFTAHGHDEKYDEILSSNGVKFFDATCTKVKDNNNLIKSNLDKGVIYIGVKGHEETNAALSISSDIVLYDIKSGIDYSLVKGEEPIVVNQTTLSIVGLKGIYEDIKLHIPHARFVDEICDATRRRQQTLLEEAPHYDLIVVVGSLTSSNTNKLVQIASSVNKNACIVRVNSLEDFNNVENINNYHRALVTSGTSTPLSLIEDVVKYLEGI